MPEGTATAKKTDQAAPASAKDPVIEILTPNASAAEAKAEPSKAKKTRVTALQALGKLKPLLPILTGGLRLVDHGAAQMLAQVLNLAGGVGAASPVSPEELQEELAKIESGRSELRGQIQDQTVEMQRIKDQITLLQQTVESNAAEHAELVESVRSLRHLIGAIGVGLAVLLVILITLTAVVLTHR